MLAALYIAVSYASVPPNGSGPNNSPGRPTVHAAVGPTGSRNDATANADDISVAEGPRAETQDLDRAAASILPVTGLRPPALLSVI
jgi:hypothetical protein